MSDPQGAPRPSWPLWRREWSALRGFGRLLRTREALVILSGAVLIICYELLKHRWLPEAVLHPSIDPRHREYYRFLGWQAVSTLCTGLIPLAICLAARWPLKEMGLGLGRPRVWAPYLALMALVMAPVIYAASTRPSFGEYYPMFYRWTGGHAGSTALDERVFWLSELAFPVYWIGWEFFFRGYLLWGTVRRFGAYAILLPVAIFAATHLAKPQPEFWASVLAAVALGWVSYRGRSIWPCVIIHWACAFSMDMLAKYGGA